VLSSEKLPSSKTSNDWNQHTHPLSASEEQRTILTKDKFNTSCQALKGVGNATRAMMSLDQNSGGPNSRWKEPNITLTQIINKGLTQLVHCLNSHTTIQNKRPLPCLMPMKLSILFNELVPLIHVSRSPNKGI
jgi:hypothetical protein